MFGLVAEKNGRDMRTILKDGQEIYDLATSFFNSALTLAANVKFNKNFNLEDFLNMQLLPAFYLMRHAIELEIKCLNSILNPNSSKKYGHGISKIWIDIGDKLHPQSVGKIESALDILGKYLILDNEELFRYDCDNQGVKKLTQLDLPTDSDFDLLRIGFEELRMATLEHIDFFRSRD